MCYSCFAVTATRRPHLTRLASPLQWIEAFTGEWVNSTSALTFGLPSFSFGDDLYLMLPALVGRGDSGEWLKGLSQLYRTLLKIVQGAARWERVCPNGGSKVM